jgi:hypothetical protein
MLTPEPSPAIRSTASKDTNPPTSPAAMNPHAVTAVPAARRRRSPQRSASNPAGI